ncbi:uncharacterized protein NPIL_620361 [Nephila pilipes]|uniref:Uncharacterized protein n=1 Tax=Nephila pilipes TaxID=299642 RepID=A0A8X6T1M3_NEPPI|nr:uncharacterized protein NPIL_620361 [Nephila pilipes]
MKQKYWIVGTRTSIHSEVRRCVTCAKFNFELSKQIWADLPAARANPGRAFLKIGMGFAGPFLMTLRRGKRVKAIKMHVCVFVCFTTKAINLELISDLSAQTCIVGTKTLSHGVKNQIKYLVIVAKMSSVQIFLLRSWELETIGNYLTNEGVKWTLNVPSAPHFGGL